MPSYEPHDFPGYTSEDQAADYPPGSYELRCNSGRGGRPADLEPMSSARNSNEVLRIALVLLVLLSLMVFGSRWFDTLLTDEVPRQKAAAAAAVVAVGEPWTALGLLEYGNALWRKSP